MLLCRAARANDCLAQAGSQASRGSQTSQESRPHYAFLLPRTLTRFSPRPGSFSWSRKPWQPRAFWVRRASRLRYTPVRAAVGGRSHKVGEQEGNEADPLLQISVLADNVKRLRQRVNAEEEDGIEHGVKTGVEFRERVDRLLNRVECLQRHAERSVVMEGRVPSQVAASVKALKREHTSLENIVKLAFENSPFDVSPVAPNHAPAAGSSSGSNKRSFEKAAFDSLASKMGSVSRSEGTVINHIPASEFGAQLPLNGRRKKNLEVVKASKQLTAEPAEVSVTEPKEYNMATPVTNDSPLAGFRAEIERRVREELKKKKFPKPIRKAVYRSSSIISQEAHKPFSPSGASNSTIDTLNAVLSSPKPSDASPHAKTSEIASEPEVGSVEWAKDGARRLTQALDQREKLATADDVAGLNTKSDSSFSIGASTNEKKPDSQVDNEEEINRIRWELEVMNNQSESDNSFDAAIAKVKFLTEEVKNRDEMLKSVKEQTMSERQELLNKVQNLTSEVSNRVTKSELNSAVTSAVTDLKQQLSDAQLRVSRLEKEVKDKDMILKQSKEEWGLEKVSLMARLRAAEIWTEALHRREKQKKEFETSRASSSVLPLPSHTPLDISLEKNESNDSNELNEIRGITKDRLERIENLKRIAERGLIPPEVARSELVKKEKIFTVEEEKELMEVRVMQVEGVGKFLWNSLGRIGHHLIDLKKKLESEESKEAISGVKSLVAQVAYTLGKGSVKLFEENVLAERKLLTTGDPEKDKNREEKIILSEAKTLIEKEFEDWKEWSPLNESVSVEDILKTETAEKLDVKEDPVLVTGNNDDVIVLIYETGWENAYLHYSTDGAEWTEVPGLLMENMEVDDPTDQKPFKVTSVAAKSIEFVLNDGNDTWDKSPTGGNYSIEGRGTYILSSGEIRKVHEISSADFVNDSSLIASDPAVNSSVEDVEGDNSPVDKVSVDSIPVVIPPSVDNSSLQKTSPDASSVEKNSLDEHFSPTSGTF